MTEKWLHHIWMYKLYSNPKLQCTKHHPIKIVDKGKYTENSGPDFQHCRINYQNVMLAGHIELHLKSSDWEKHHHSNDPNYHNVILHIVYEHDRAIPFLEERGIPTLELKSFITENTLSKFQTLQHHFSFIPCEELLKHNKVDLNFLEALLIKKLDEKASEFQHRLDENKQHHEALLFTKLTYSFGLKINAPYFEQIAESIDFSIIRKIQHNLDQLEALFYGRSGWLNETDNDDDMVRFWANEYQFLQSKFGIDQQTIAPLFLRLRPSNFPTLRLSQFAAFYHHNIHLVSQLKTANSIKDLEQLFDKVEAHPYWNNHYKMGKLSSNNSPKKLSKDFIHSIIINTLLPFVYFYNKENDEEIWDKIITLFRQLPPEKNRIISEWKTLGIQAKNAAETQALLYLHKHFCNEKKCLNCSIGYQLLK